MNANIPALTLSCATSIYTNRPPTFRYALNTYGLLMMTAAHESDNWRARRQYTFAATERRMGQRNYRGAFGLHQLEEGSVIDSLIRVQRNDALLSRCAYWLQMQNCTAASWLSTRGVERQILDAMREPAGDAVSILFARLHYFRVPAPIPSTAVGWADYAKKHYNTHLGRATPGDYLNAWKALPAEVRWKQR